MLDLTQSSPYILLAEDNPADIELVREAFKDRAVCCDLCVLRDGEEAAEAIRQIDRDRSIPCPELVLLDLHLPRLNGEEVLRTIRASTRCRETPVVMMTSSDLPREAMQSSVHYFRKPANLDQFLMLGDVVNRIVRRNAAA